MTGDEMQVRTVQQTKSECDPLERFAALESLSLHALSQVGAIQDAGGAIYPASKVRVVRLNEVLQGRQAEAGNLLLSTVLVSS